LKTAQDRKIHFTLNNVLFVWNVFYRITTFILFISQERHAHFLDVCVCNVLISLFNVLTS